MQIDYNNVLYFRRNENCMYVRFKNEKTEHVLQYETVLSYDKDAEFFNYCEKLEECYKDEIKEERYNMWKYISDDSTPIPHKTKTYFTKHDKVYSNGTINIYRTPYSNKWVIWSRNKPFSSGSCVVKSNKPPMHIPAIMSCKRVPAPPVNRNLISSLIILTNDESYKKRLNNVWHDLFDKETSESAN